MSKITYIKGDATYPVGDGKKLITHICNDIGAWGAGFVLAISMRWPEPEDRYHVWHKSGDSSFTLGNVQIVPVEDDISVVNMIGQHGVGFYQGPPIRYPAVRQCLKKVSRAALRSKASVHMPRIGCGLAGGHWDKIKEIVYEELVDLGIDVIVYDID